MKHYALYKPSGEIVAVGEAQESSLQGYFALQKELRGIVLESPIDPETHWIDPKALKVEAYPPGEARRRGGKGESGRSWNPAAAAWVDDRGIEEIRADMLARLKAHRDRLLRSGVTWGGSVFDSDPEISQPRLLGAFVTAISGGWPEQGIAWRLANNSWRTLSATDVSGVWAALQARMSALFAAFRDKESEVKSERSIAKLRAYGPDSGWPE